MPQGQTVAPSGVGFDNATRHNLVALQDMAYSAGGKSTQALPKLGYLSALNLEVEGSVTMAHASNTTATKSAYGPYNLINRLRLSVNNIDIVDLSGYELALMELISTYNWRGDASGDAQCYAFGNTISAGGTANSIVFQLHIPVAMNDRDLIGLVLLQSEQTQVTLSIDWATVTAATGPYTTPTEVTTFSAISFTAHPTIEVFDVPANEADRPRIDHLFQTVSHFKDVAAVGEQIIDLPRGNVYTKFAMYGHINGSLAANTDFTNLVVMYNQNTRPYNLRSASMRGINRRMYGRDIPTGSYVFDFNHQGIPNLGTSRDYVNTAAITDVQLRPTIAAGATLGTAPKIHVVRQQLLRVA